MQDWYTGPEIKHYHCYKFYISKTIVEHIVDIVEFFPENIKVPVISSANSATHAATYLISAKIADILQGQISSKTTLWPTENHIKVVEQGVTW